MDIDTLTERDTAAAHAISAGAGWTSRERDWRQLFETPCVHALAGRLDDELVATATVAVYQARIGSDRTGAVAWIGTLLVDEAHRRRGYGSEIFDAALSFATDRADTVGLDANEQGKPIYEATRFVRVSDADKWRGTLDTTAPLEVVEQCTDPAEVAALDARACGVDRSELLRSLFADPTSRAFVRREEGTVSGYVLVRPSMDGWTVGPLITTHRDSVAELLAAVGRVTRDETVTLDVAGDSGVADTYRDAGLERVRTLTRMTYDQSVRALLGEQVRAIPGFAFG